MSEYQHLKKHERLKIIREKLGYGVKGKVAFAQLMDFDYQNYGRMESGARDISTKFIENMSKRFINVNLHWLITGIGEPLLNTSIKNVTIIDNDTPNVRFYNIEAIAGLAISAGKQELSEWIYIPTLDRNKKYYALPVSGNSMIPALKDEDIVICELILNLLEEFVNGKIYVIVLRDKILVKRIYILGDQLELKSDNPFFKSELVNTDDLLKLFKVIKVITSPRSKEGN